MTTPNSDRQHPTTPPSRLPFRKPPGTHPRCSFLQAPSPRIFARIHTRVQGLDPHCFFNRIPPSRAYVSVGSVDDARFLCRRSFFSTAGLYADRHYARPRLVSCQRHVVKARSLQKHQTSWPAGGESGRLIAASSGSAISISCTVPRFAQSARGSPFAGRRTDNPPTRPSR